MSMAKAVTYFFRIYFSVTTNTLKLCGGILQTDSCNHVTLIKISKNIHMIGYEAFTFET